jgi:hypothetical protein
MQHHPIEPTNETQPINPIQKIIQSLRATEPRSTQSYPETSYPERPGGIQSHPESPLSIPNKAGHPESRAPQGTAAQNTPEQPREA